MHFHVKIQQICRKNIFTNKQTVNKVPLIFSEVKVLTEAQQFRFRTLSTNKQDKMYVFMYAKKGKRKARMMFLNVEVEQYRRCSCSSRLH